MTRLLFALAVGAALASAPALAGPADDALFGKDAGADRALACFVRHYDAKHLSSHPQQNVTDMAVLVDRPEPSEGDVWYTLSIGVNFRDIKDQMQVSGGCSAMDDGSKLLGCGVECDGGQIDVRPRDANSILVDIPYGARTWNPNDVEADDLENAAFGPDDKVFRLDRAELGQCLSLVYDDALKAQLAAAQ
jgi:hypothetical protein